jgi:4-amino-4-deoxy-L-arabinose transferase-like glycosyltransferase
MTQRKDQTTIVDTSDGRKVQLSGACSKWLSNVVVLVLIGTIGIAVVGIENSWTNLSATYDEPYHIASGMEWLHNGPNTNRLENPPLASVVVALGPYFRGLRSPSLWSLYVEGNTILYSDGSYSSNLASARCSNLIFFALACIAIFQWARGWFNRTAAIWAVILFLNLPPILGHAGLATLDMACTATVAIALYAFIRCIENPSWQRLVLLGMALAFAFLCKFSSLPFLALGFLGAFVYFAAVTRDAVPSFARWRLWILRALIVSAVAFVLFWGGGYRFSCQPIKDHSIAHPSIDRVFAKKPVLRGLVYKAIEIPVPLGQFARQMYELQNHNATGHDSYLLGKYRRTGWWYFFLVVVAVKTPIGFLILAGCGIVAILREGLRSCVWQRHLTVIFPGAITLVCLSSKIDLGVRHILPIYPFPSVPT